MGEYWVRKDGTAKTFLKVLGHILSEESPLCQRTLAFGPCNALMKGREMGRGSGTQG